MASNKILRTGHLAVVGSDSQARDQEVGLNEIEGAGKGEEGGAEPIVGETGLPEQESEARAIAYARRAPYCTQEYSAMVPKVLQQGEGSG